ncbi:MAG: threonine--tRNA ligase, partial [Planctomycetia bacterium]|nr:threonine--tRNA ligase [Planctomycetia bacterium]
MKFLVNQTDKDLNSLQTLRHSAAHVMAQAVGRLYKGVKFGIGPAIENGFYYDFDLAERLSDSDLQHIEEEMVKIIAEAAPFERSEMSIDDAKAEMEKLDQPYKIELLEQLQQRDGVEVVSLYRSSEFVDLCRGPHLADAGKVVAFKLLSVAGSYWRGDETRPMLQRIYGTALPTEKELRKHLSNIEEAKKRDHRLLGKQMDLFSFHPEGPGFAFFHGNGMTVLRQMLDFWRQVHIEAGYEEISTPIVLSEELWHRSGHWDNYRELMYSTEIDERPYAVKPMNCPGGLLVYKSRPHSYRELPLRMAELGLVHRHEKGGVLHGLLRVRQFTQDDAHIFCLPEQLRDEVVGVLDLVEKIYAAFGFDQWDVELSTRPFDHYIGTDEMWDEATGALRDALATKGLDYQVNEGEGAFYAPKIDFHIRDCLGRRWQCGTIQVDLS